MVNVGSVDRAIRFILGAVLLLAPFLATEAFAGIDAWRYLIATVGAVLLGTAIFRVCPAYMIFGIRTCSVRPA